MGSVRLVLQTGVSSRPGRHHDLQDATTAQPDLWAVADGVTHAARGREAAEVAVEAAAAALRRSGSIRDAVQQAHQSVLATVPDGAAQLLVARYLDGSLSVASAGDCGAYRLDRRGNLSTLVDPRSAGQRPVGAGPDDLHVQVALVELEPLDRILLCTDGVHGALAASALARSLSEDDDATRAADRVVERALAAYDQADDATAIVIDVQASRREGRLAAIEPLSDQDAIPGTGRSPFAPDPFEPDGQDPWARDPDPLSAPTERFASPPPPPPTAAYPKVSSGAARLEADEAQKLAKEPPASETPKEPAKPERGRGSRAVRVVIVSLIALLVLVAITVALVATRQRGDTGTTYAWTSTPQGAVLSGVDEPQPLPYACEAVAGVVAASTTARFDTVAEAEAWYDAVTVASCAPD